MIIVKGENTYMAVSIKQLKPGNAYTENTDLFLCISNEQNKQGRLSGKYMVKRKNMRTGSITEISYNPTEKVELAMIEKRKMQYLYDSGDMLVFMDNETFEQTEIPSDRLKWELNFLKPSDEVEITSHEGEVLGVSLPINVPLTITETEPAVKGDTATGATKNATVETGLQIRVPLFISEGEVVMVNTQDGKYQGRA